MADAMAIAAPEVTWLAPDAMIALRGDAGVLASGCAALGLSAPGLRKLRVDGARAVAWMAPDELLFMLPAAEGAGALTTLAAALAGQLHLAVDLSDARARFAITGGGAREVIAKGAPVDLRRAAFAPVTQGEGDFRRTRLGQIAAAFWMPAEGEAMLICFRSVAEHADAWLRQAARAGSLPGVL
jgi:sarcosine oxidase subunit gamma